MDVVVWAQRIIDRLQEHMDSEREALISYGRLVEAAPDGHVRFLMNLILEDERRHHQLFADMAEQLRREVDQRGGAGLPEMRRTMDTEALRGETKALLELEREDLKMLRDLRKEVAKVADTRWWTALIDIMDADNRKHITILEFVRDNA
jgi:rubrerythrin